MRMPSLSVANRFAAGESPLNPDFPELRDELNFGVLLKCPLLVY